MGMAIGGDESLNFKLGAEQVDRLFLGSAYVWPNVPIADVVATDDQVGLVTITWSDTNDVLPNYYYLYADGVQIATNVTSPYDYTIDESTKMYSVRGMYGGGHFIGSNEDSGTSLSGLIPGPIIDFVASDNRVYEVQCHWSNASGDPVPTYDLYEDGGIVAQGVSSGHVIAAAPGTRPWHVMAVNAEGETKSNVDNGTALEACTPMNIEFNTPGSHGVSFGTCGSATFCMVGGGYGGQAQVTPGSDLGIIAAGGNANEGLHTTVSVGGSETAFVGAGGVGGYVSPIGGHDDGNEGQDSTIAGQTGFRGMGANYYNGEPRSTCYGTAYNGLVPTECAQEWGGQAGFGDGGNGGCNAIAPGTGYKGGGGGGGGGNLTYGHDAYGGDGGNGVIHIITGGYQGKTTLVELLSKEELIARGIRPFVNIADFDVAHELFRLRANMVIAVWELSGHSPTNDYKNLSSVLRYRIDIDALKANYNARELCFEMRKGDSY